MRILLIAYDNDCYISNFPLGLAYIAAALRKAGHEVSVYHQDVYHYPEPHLVDYLDRNCFDAVGLGVVGGYYQVKKLLLISDAVRKARRKPFYILGGHGPSPEPAYFLAKTGADAIVIGEGEETIIDLLDALEHKRDLATVDGIAFFSGQQCVQTRRRPLIKDLDTIAFPAWDLFKVDHYALQRSPRASARDRMLPVLTGRGCTFHCNFCYRMDEGLRLRSVDAVVEELIQLKADWGISYVEFWDELLMCSEKRAVELSEAFIRARLGLKWYCQGRLNYAKPDVLRVMKEAGCVFINYGIESLDEDALKRMNKALTVRQITEGIENTLQSGISPGFNIIWGNIGETAESLRLGVEFLLKYDDHSQLRTIRPVTPYPGSPLYDYAIKQGKLKDCADFYEHKHLNSDLLTVNFTDLTEDEFYQNLYKANKCLIDAYYRHLELKTEQTLHSLYGKRDASFRGFRHT